MNVRLTSTEFVSGDISTIISFTLILGSYAERLLFNFFLIESSVIGSVVRSNNVDSRSQPKLG